MTRERRNTHEQLAFPELELPSASLSTQVSSDPLGEMQVLVPEVAQSTLPERDPGAHKASRRRGAKPKMILVSEPVEAWAPDAGCQFEATESVEVSTTSLDSAEWPGAEQLQIPADCELEKPASRSAAQPVMSAAPKPAIDLNAANEQFLDSSSPDRTKIANKLEQALPPTPNPFARGNRLKNGAHVATILASLAVVLTLIIGASQFIETGKQQQTLLAAQKDFLQQERGVKAAELNARAVELFLRYNELMLQVNATVSKAAKKETRYWKENLAINLLESLFNLTRGNKDWEITIGWALEKHGRFIRDQQLSCASYSNEFVHHLEKVIGAKATSLCKDLARFD